MGRFAGLLAATGGSLQRRSAFGKWLEVMSRARDGEVGARNSKKCLSLLKATGMQLSSPIGRAALRMSGDVTSTGNVLGDKTATSGVAGNRAPVAVWFNDGHSPGALIS